MGIELKRRQVLQGIGAVAATTLGANCKQGEPPPASGTIDHVVLVMMENRSFDHYFGALKHEEGRSVLATPLDFANVNREGLATFPHLAHNMCIMQDPPHSWNSSRVQYSGGECSGFIEAMIQRHGGSGYDPGLVMGYHNRSQLPVSYGLADQYTLCQRWFGSQLSSTWPNRMYSHAAQNMGIRGNSTPSGSIFYDVRTLWHLLEEAGKEWSYYYSDLPFIALLKDVGSSERVRRIEEFYWDCENGTLPSVCMVEPSFSFNDDHPPHHPLLGQLFLATVHNALAQSPAWERTLLVINYDENGGFFDHVSPPLLPDARANEGFDQAGFRVPALACGPWVKPGWVDDEVRDHTSSLKGIQELFDLESLTERDEAAIGFDALLDHASMEAGTPNAPATLPVIEMSEEEIQTQCDTENRRGGFITGQHELETFLQATDNPLWRDRSTQISSIRAQQIENAIRFGALRIR
jgi:phospholipase C